MRSPVVGPNRSAYAARESSGIEGTSGLPAQAGHDTGAGERNEFDVDGDPGLEAHGGAGGDVEPLAARRGAVEVQTGIGLGEVVVGADLDGPVGGVENGQPGDLAALVEDDGSVGEQDLRESWLSLPRQTIGSWTVTSLVPSGKVAST